MISAHRKAVRFGEGTEGNTGMIQLEKQINENIDFKGVWVKLKHVLQLTIKVNDGNKVFM